MKLNNEKCIGTANGDGGYMCVCLHVSQGRASKCRCRPGANIYGAPLIIQNIVRPKYSLWHPRALSPFVVASLTGIECVTIMYYINENQPIRITNVMIFDRR